MSENNERIAKLEVLIEHLSEEVKRHMEKEEQERKELMLKIDALTIGLETTNAFISGKKQFLAGVIAAVSLVWMVAFGLVEFFKHFSGK